MYQSIFKRIEEKIILTKEQYIELLKRIEKYIQKDKYYETTICNIYFDNDNNDLIIDSLEKNLYKFKIRLRSYGIPSLEDYVYLEIKSKYKGIVGKRRIKLKLKEFNDYIKNHEYDKENQIMREIDYLFKLYNLKPAIFIAYDRHSYCGKDDESLRITIDANLRSRTNNLSLEKGDKGNHYFEEETYIMEIKSLYSMPLWLVRNLSELHIYTQSFSKYGRIYQKEKENK